MVVGLGIDVVEVERVSLALARWGERLVARLMDPEEASSLPPGQDRPQALARAIALKEAASKAIGTGWSRGVRWRDVVTAPGPAASVSLRGRALAVAHRLGSSGRCWSEAWREGELVMAEVRLLA